MKKSLIVPVGITVLILIGAVTMLIARDSSKSRDKWHSLDSMPEYSEHASPPFVSEGDVLGAMTVVSVTPFNTGQYSTDPKWMRLAPNNVQITLKGPIEVTGTYMVVHSEIGFDGYCMSISDVLSLSRMPTLPVRGGPADVRSYFCFRNSDTVQKALGEKSRTVTVTIDNYQLNAYPAEVMDWADLVNVVSKVQ